MQTSIGTHWCVGAYGQCVVSKIFFYVIWRMAQLEVDRQRSTVNGPLFVNNYECSCFLVNRLLLQFYAVTFYYRYYFYYYYYYYCYGS
jgi:hypothetical protein